MTKGMEEKMEEAKKVGEILQGIAKQAKPLDSKNILVEGNHCVMQQFADKVEILFSTPEDARDFYIDMGDKINYKKKLTFKQRIKKWLKY